MLLTPTINIYVGTKYTSLYVTFLVANTSNLSLSDTLKFDVLAALKTETGNILLLDSAQCQRHVPLQQGCTLSDAYLHLDLEMQWARNISHHRLLLASGFIV